MDEHPAPRCVGVHLDDEELHATLKAWCRERGICIRDWVGLLIQVAVAEARGFAGEDVEDDEHVCAECAGGQLP
jgi:hypothetical protein